MFETTFYCKRCSITDLNGTFEMFCIDVHSNDIFVGKIIKILHTLAFDEHEAARGCTLSFLGWQKVLFDTCALQICSKITLITVSQTLPRTNMTASTHLEGFFWVTKCM